MISPTTAHSTPTDCTQRLRPASNMKVITAVAALDLLGADYRSPPPSQASGEPDDSGRVSNVYIRGGMDPLFAHDDLRSIVEELRRHGVRKLWAMWCSMPR